MLGLLKKKKKGYCKDLENCLRVRETFCFITLIYLVEDRRLNSITVNYKLYFSGFRYSAVS